MKEIHEKLPEKSRPVYADLIRKRQMKRGIIIIDLVVDSILIR